MSSVREDLLAAAENRIRRGGFHAVSFRDLASDLGIKSASVHYHFPKKEDLGVAVIDRYSAAFFSTLEERTEAGEDQVTAFVDTYRQSLNSCDTACLCGVMGAETLGLPDSIRTRLSKFLQDNVDWLAEAYSARGDEKPRTHATRTVASLQGAMMLAINLSDEEVFEKVAGGVTDR